VIGTAVSAADGIVLVDARRKRRTMPNLGYEHSF
jgi:hypothetical protein